MGIFNFGGYYKPGSGVDENAPRNTGIKWFAESYVRKFWKLIQLNLMYLLAILPTFAIVFLLSGVISNTLLKTQESAMAGLLGMAGVDFSNPDFAGLFVSLDIALRLFCAMIFTIFWGMGPVTAGLSFILRNYAREEHAWLWSDFWHNAKTNFKQGLAVYIIDTIMMIVFFYAFIFYSSAPGFMSVFKYVIAAFFAFYTVIHFYIWQMMVTYKLSLGRLIKNSAIIAIAALPHTLLVLLLLAALTFGFAFLAAFALSGPQAVILVFVWGALLLFLVFSTCGYIVNFNAEAQLRKYMVDNGNTK